MAIDFTVIQSVRQRFGDIETGGFPDPSLGEQEAPFVGLSKDFPFSCPGIDTTQQAVLQFESLGVTAPRSDLPYGSRNILQINGKDIPGSITAGQSDFWKTHSLLIPPNVLAKEQNVLHVESVILSQDHSPHYDDFIIDNVVVFFKIEPPPTKQPPVIREV